jgi:hypothetical protein
VKTRPNANCGSDPELLTATQRIKLKDTQVKKGWKLDIDNIPKEYKTDIKQKLTAINRQRGNSGEIWKALNDTFKEVTDKNIPRKERKKDPLGCSKAR